MEKLNDWSAQKDRINQLYKEKTLSEVQAIMEEQFGHKGSLKQYKDRLKAWGFDKNIKDADMRVMLRKQLKRKVEDGKETEFFLNEKQIPPEKMNRFVKRKKLDDEMIAAADMPTPSYITCQTPEPTADIEGTSRDIEAISHDMQFMMTIQEDDEVHNQTKSDDVDSKPNNKSIISSSREVLKGPPQNAVDVDSDIPGTKEEQQEFAARMAHFISYSDWSDLEAILQDKPTECLNKYRSKPELDVTLSHFLSCVKLDQAYPVVLQRLELALLFLFHLKELNAWMGQLFREEYEEFQDALHLSAYVLSPEFRFNQVPTPQSLRWLGSSMELLPDMYFTIDAAHNGEWGAWRKSLRKLQSYYSGSYCEKNTPSQISHTKNIPFGPQEPLIGDYITELVEEAAKTPYLPMTAQASFNLPNHTSNEHLEQRTGTSMSFPFCNKTTYESLQQPTETNTASPIETISARYHLSNSPTCYYHDIEISNPLHHLSPVLFNTQSPYTAIYKAQSPQYRFGIASSPLAMLLETPPMSEFPY